MIQTILQSAAERSHWRRLGKVKLGIKVKGNNPTRCTSKTPHTHQHTDDCYNFYPKDVKYFVLPKQFQEKLGAEPMKLNIMLAFPTLEQNYDIDSVMWKGNGQKFCSTKDGITAQRLVSTMVPNAKDGKMEEHTDYETIPCPGDACEFRKAGKCPYKGGLDFMIPAVYPEVGTFFLRVGSKVSYLQMLATLLDLQKLCVNRPNGMQYIKMILEREFTVFPSVMIKGVRTRVEKYIPKLSVDYAALSAADKQLLGAAVGQNFEIPAEITEEELQADLREDEPAKA